MEDLVKYICVGASSSKVELGLSQLRDEKCCYTYLDSGETKQFTGKVSSVWIGSKYSLDYKVSLKSLTESHDFDDCAVYKSGTGGLGIFVKNLINVE